MPRKPLAERVYVVCVKMTILVGFAQLQSEIVHTCVFNEPQKKKAHLDAADLQAAAPWLSDAQAGKLARLRNATALNAKQKVKYLKLLRDGMAHADILYKLKSNRNSYTLTRALDRDFAKQVEEVKGSRFDQIEAALRQYATGKAKLTKTTYSAVFNDFGEPERREGQAEVLH